MFLSCCVLMFRTLTDRQRALLTSYAEDETDVDGTVNGVTNTTAGIIGHMHTDQTLPLLRRWSVIMTGRQQTVTYPA